jgi:signal transduction histidine kinase/ActR/RegA family two-component response regulator
MGSLCASLGALIVVAPHRFTAPLFVSAPFFRDAWGVCALAAGTLLLGVATLRPNPSRARTVHLFAAATLSTLAAAFAFSGIWVATLAYVILAAATAAAPWLRSAEAPERTPDLYALAMGLVAVLNGASLLALPAASRAPYFGASREWVSFLGGLLLGGGLATVAAQRAAAWPRWLWLLAHVAGGAAFLAFGLLVSARQQAWTALGVNTLYGLTLAATPWLSGRLAARHVATLRVRFGFVLAASTSLATILTAALLTRYSTNTEEEIRDVTLLSLVWIVPLAIVLGALLARRLARPLAVVAAAIDAVPGPAAVRLPASSGISEVERLAHAFDDMQRRLRERTRESERLAEELRARADALSAADRRKNEFLAVLSHELRNPIGAIANSAALLRRLDAGDERRDRAVDIVERQVQHLSRLLEDLLDVARVTNGTVTLRPEAHDFRAIVGRAAETVAPLFSARDQELALDLGPNPLPVHADATRLEQVVVNLLRNAAQYSPARTRVELEASSTAESIVMRVRDHGVGIVSEHLPRVFEPFFRGRRSGAGTESGLGIGLSLVQLLVRLHGGSVAAASRGAGLGSEFTVRLPLAPAAPTEASGSPPERTASPPLRILVIEDDADAAASLAMLLRSAGHAVETVPTGEDAVSQASRIAPDLVLIDIGLPGIDGVEVARRLRTDGGFVGARLVALTGYGQEEDRRRGRDAGFDDYLVKPLEPQRLQQVLGTTLALTARVRAEPGSKTL